MNHKSALFVVAAISLLHPSCVSKNFDPQGSRIEGHPTSPLPRFSFGAHSGTHPDGSPAYSDGERIKAGSKIPAPKGYTLGMGEMYRRLRGRLEGQEDRFILAMVVPPDKSNPNDCLVRYRKEFEELGLNVARSEADRLRALYLVLYELGVRESFGKYYEGIDRGKYKSPEELARLNSTDPRIRREVAGESEAGLFCSSWNYSNRNPLARELFEVRNSETDDLLKVFSIEVSQPVSNDENLQNFGTGTGVDFQKLAKRSPSFATEYAALTLRKTGVNNYHFTKYAMMDFKPEVLLWLRSLESN